MNKLECLFKQNSLRTFYAKLKSKTFHLGCIFFKSNFRGKEKNFSKVAKVTFVETDYWVENGISFFSFSYLKLLLEEQDFFILFLNK
jgi:hypothetical protein